MIRQLLSATTVLIASMAVGASTASAATAAKPMSFRYSGSYASASSYSASGCVEQGLSVTAASSASRDSLSGSTSLRGTVVFVDIWRYDSCKNRWSSSFGLLENATTTKLNNLRGARITGSVATSSYSSGSDAMTAGPTVAFDLTLSPTGKVTTYSYNSRSNPKRSGYVDHGTGKYRTASVAGTLTVNGSAVGVGTLEGALGTETFGGISFGDPILM